jgi:hypothetical protein
LVVEVEAVAKMPVVG